MTDANTDLPPHNPDDTPGRAPGGPDDRSVSDRAVDAWLALTAREGWDGVTLAMIADEAGVGLADLRAEHGSKLSLLTAFSQQIDEAALREAALDVGLADEPPRDRLFDVVMGRLEALSPHREALARIAEAAPRDPELAAALLARTRTALTWMMEGARVPTTGWRGRRRRALLALAWGRTLATFLEDDDPEMGRTMAALDRHLREAERRDRQAEAARAKTHAVLRGRIDRWFGSAGAPANDDTASDETMDATTDTTMGESPA